MAQKTRPVDHPSSDDDEAPEVISQTTSKADAKRDQKARLDFASEEKARQKARNRERDQKLKERANVTKAGRKESKKDGKEPLDERIAGDVDEEEDEGSEMDDESDGNEERSAVEARMLRALRDAAEETESGEDEEEDEDGEFTGFGGGDSDDDMESGSGIEEDYGDDAMSQEERDLDSATDPETQTDDMIDASDDEEIAPPPKKSRPPKRNADYLADDLFVTAFSSQKSKPSSQKADTAPSKREPPQKRRRKATARPKDLVVGGRTIRTLPRASDPRSQATARTLPSSRTRKFADQSLALKGKQAIAKAKMRGWERRPANVGVMKYEGAPLGFVRSRQ